MFNMSGACYLRTVNNYHRKLAYIDRLQLYGFIWVQKVKKNVIHMYYNVVYYNKNAFTKARIYGNMYYISNTV